jgi:hypothetical protein
MKIEITSDSQTVFEMATKQSAPSVYTQYKDLIHLLLGFLFTGLIGTFLTQRLDDSNTSRQREFELTKEAVTGSTSFFRELSVMLDGRRWESQQMIFEMLKFVDKYDPQASTAEKDAQRLQLKSAYASYYKSVANYNASLNSTRVLIFKYFSKNAELQFFGEDYIDGTPGDSNRQSITGGFFTLHNLIREAKDTLLVDDSSGAPKWSGIGGAEYTKNLQSAQGKIFDKIYRFYNSIRNCMIYQNTVDRKICHQ